MANKDQRFINPIHREYVSIKVLDEKTGNYNVIKTIPMNIKEINHVGLTGILVAIPN